MFAGKPYFPFTPAYVRIPLLLVGMIDDECALLPWIVRPGFCDYRLQVLSQAGMDFIHITDQLLDPFVLAELVQMTRVILVSIGLQQAPMAGLAVGGMPDFKILIRRSK